MFDLKENSLSPKIQGLSVLNQVVKQNFSGISAFVTWDVSDAKQVAFFGCVVNIGSSEKMVFIGVQKLDQDTTSSK